MENDELNALAQEIDSLSAEVLGHDFLKNDAGTHVRAAEKLVTIYGKFTLAMANREVELSFDPLRLAEVHLRLAEFKR
jgi:uncharacterized ferredoxin-like protein